MLSITKALSRLPQKQVKAVLWAGGNPLLTGNYYYLHHPVPVYHLYFDFKNGIGKSSTTAACRHLNCSVILSRFPTKSLTGLRR